ncbi:DUF6443 domain-containing protein [Chitinophaga defluvii]|uniref:DUF6443 domain-containing protein n=1 Tax=Chitinophaga defluvii TaxID=3163343 RepID=A0ABV2T521_9BACT
MLVLGTTAAMSQNTPKSSARPTVTPIAKPSPYGNGILNYVRTWEPSMPSTDLSVITAPTRTVAEVKQTTQYSDGVGRPLQTVNKGMSPLGKDLVTPVIYDAFGREQYKYIPYVSTGSDGKFKTSPFTEQAIFMGTQFPGERIYYGETRFEASPLSQVKKAMEPGDNWTGVGRGIEKEYLVNTAADDVQIWKIQQNDARPISSGAYAAGQLLKNITKDERGNRVVEFVNKGGQVVLKKSEILGNAADGHNNWLCTYYVYDDMGLLHCVIPPKAVTAIKSNWNANFTLEIAKELCFVYRYDSRNRMIVKQVPGADSVEMVYDVRDRLVFTRDGNLRQKTPKQWLVTFYDGLNRPTMTALYNSAATRETLQASMNTATSNTQSISYNVPYVTDLAITSHDGRARYEATNSITFNDGFDSGTSAAFETFLDANGTQHTLSITATNPLPNLQPTDLYPLTYTFYDGYGYAGAHAALTSDFNKPQKGNNPYDEPVTATSTMTKGLVTGVKARVLGTNDWLTTTTYYNDKGRVIQTVGDNAVGGKDILTNLYDFNGKLLSSYQRHQAPRSTLTTETPVLTMLSYDAAGRLDSVKKRLKDNLSLQRVISKNTYDELGQLKTKKLGVINATKQIEKLNYDYNIRGWLIGINKAYVNGTGNPDSTWFGMELNYDSGFVVNQYNGNITGTKWKSRSNSIARAYGFAYDSVNRLMSAYYSQQNTVNAPTTPWEKTQADFAVSNLSYDDNGNIMRMDQQGMDGAAIVALDKLTYAYKANSNKLGSVTDVSTVTTKLGDFKNGANSGDDYAYDTNGNLILDNNKNITAITYNHLNLPEQITILNKGTIKYLYDAAGNKLRKTVIDNTVTPAKTTITDYAGGLVYQNDTLQFLGHEEGRIRVVYKTGQAPVYWYDYFVKDHLGNVRMVLTEQSDLTMYAATMETEAAPMENALFSNIDNSRMAKPVGYPEDNTTEENEFVAKLNAKDGGKKIGPSLVLRVMAGDTIQIGAKAFYKSQGPQENKKPAPVEDMLASLAQAFSGSAGGEQSHAVASSEATSPFANNFTSSDYQRLQQKDPDQFKLDKPKAYLNFVLFNDQFNLVEENSGVKQVQGEPDQLQTLAKDKMVVQQSGFLYVYTSNESPQDVFFDNLMVTQANGPLLEETHYYPFGLTMAGISSKSITQLENKKEKFQGQPLDDDLDLNWYGFKWRNHDPQIGRFIEIDPLASKYEYNSPYAFSENKITSHIELEGLESLPINQNSNPFSYMAVGFGQMFETAANAIDNIFTFGSKTKVEVPISAVNTGNVTVTVSSVNEAKTEYGFNLGDYLTYVKSNGSNDGNPISLFNNKTTMTTSLEEKTEAKFGGTSLFQKIRSSEDAVIIDNGGRTSIKVKGLDIMVGGMVSTTSNGDIKEIVDVSTGSSTTQARLSVTTSQGKKSSVELGASLVQKAPKATVTSSIFLKFGLKKSEED